MEQRRNWKIQSQFCDNSRDIWEIKVLLLDFRLGRLYICYRVWELFALCLLISEVSKFLKVKEIILWVVDWRILYRTKARQWQNSFSDVLYSEDGQFKIVCFYGCVKPVQANYGDFFFLHQKLAEFLGRFQLLSLLWFLLKVFADCSQGRNQTWYLQSGK